MLARAQRLPRREFTRFFASGARYHTPNLTLIYTPAPTFVAAVVVSKKVAKLAHERNTIRRRLYAALANEVKVNDLAGVIILVVKPPLKKLTRLEQHAAIPTILSLLRKGR